MRSALVGEVHRWACVVSDGVSWRYISVLGPPLGPHPELPPETIEEGIERFAATLPETGRIRALLIANPLHVDHDGIVTDFQVPPDFSPVPT